MSSLEANFLCGSVLVLNTDVLGVLLYKSLPVTPPYVWALRVMSPLGIGINEGLGEHIFPSESNL